MPKSKLEELTDETERYLQALRLECVKLAVANAGPGVEKKEPWGLANKYYTYVLYGKAMEVA
jgi:hypothetical protein